MQLPFTGTCQCGGTHYEITQQPLITVVCHCRDCQKLSAGAFSLTMLIKRDSFRLIRGELRCFSRPADSGNTADCYFCSICGNRIYHENPAAPGVIRLKPGTLDNTGEIIPDAHVWTSRAQPWVTIPAGIPQFETQPDIAQFLRDRAGP